MRQILTIFFVILILLSLTVSCFATFALFSFDNYNVYFRSSVPVFSEAGNYTVTIVSNAGMFTTTATVYENSAGLLTSSVYTSNLGGSPAVFNFTVRNSSPPSICLVENSNVTSFRAEFVKITSVSFEESVDSGLGSVIGYINQVISSLVNGSLLPLFQVLAIAISISLLFVGIKVIFFAR